METIKNWAIVLCYAAVAAGMAGIIAPHGNMEKTYRFVISVFFLACVLVPVFSIRHVSLPADVFAEENGSSMNAGVESLVKQQQTQAAEAQLEQMTESCCETCGAAPVSVDAAVTESGGALGAGTVTVTLAPGDLAKKDAIAAKIKEKLGLDVRIREKGE